MTDRTEYSDNTNLFPPKELYHKNGQHSEKVAASKVKEFKHTHQTRIEELLRLYPDSTAKELERLSDRTYLSMTQMQISRRIKDMATISVNEMVSREGCHPMKLR